MDGSGRQFFRNNFSFPEKSSKTQEIQASGVFQRHVAGKEPEP
jgi:hypothetical protein